MTCHCSSIVESTTETLSEGSSRRERGNSHTSCQIGKAKLPQDILCCVGGGGFIAGLALGFADLVGDGASKVVTVEPQAVDALHQSLSAGERVTVTSGPASICDALQAPAPGAVPFAALQGIGTRSPLTVTDDDVRQAMWVATEQLGIVLEPSGAVPLAGFVSALDRWQDRDVQIIASGRNVTAHAFAGHLGVQMA